MELHLRVVGILLIILSLIHIGFPRYFQWKAELARISLINRQMMYSHMFFIALMLLMMGVFCVQFPAEVVTTRLGKVIALGLGMFWFIRLLIQFFGYSSKLWKGKRFETVIHIVFSLLWGYMTAVFLIIYFVPL